MNLPIHCNSSRAREFSHIVCRHKLITTPTTREATPMIINTHAQCQTRAFQSWIIALDHQKDISFPV